MRNTKFKIRFIEHFIVATFPLALAVGCSATGDQKPSDVSMRDELTVQQQASIKENELNNVTFTEHEPTGTPTITSQSKPVNDDPIAESDNSSQIIQATNTENPLESNMRVEDTTVTEETAITPVNMAMPNVSKKVKPETAIVHFAVNQFDINEQDLTILQHHADYLKENPGIAINVNGYSDSRGSAKHNFELSKKRAQQVAKVLISLGVPESQIKVNSYGESFPLHDEKNWDENRRVELQYSDNPSDEDELMANAAIN